MKNLPLILFIVLTQTGCYSQSYQNISPTEVPSIEPSIAKQKLFSVFKKIYRLPRTQEVIKKLEDNLIGVRALDDGSGVYYLGNRRSAHALAPARLFTLAFVQTRIGSKGSVLKLEHIISTHNTNNSVRNSYYVKIVSGIEICIGTTEGEPIFVGKEQPRFNWKKRDNRIVYIDLVSDCVSPGETMSFETKHELIEAVSILKSAFPDIRIM